MRGRGPPRCWTERRNALRCSDELTSCPQGLGDSGCAADDEGSGDDAFVDALRRGDESAFASLVDRYYDTMLRVARMHVATRGAEDVVQGTFLGVIRGLDHFEARSSLRTWMFRILINQAKREVPGVGGERRRAAGGGRLVDVGT